MSEDFGLIFDRVSELQMNMMLKNVKIGQNLVRWQFSYQNCLDMICGCTKGQEISKTKCEVVASPKI